ncbi:type IX secretion system anionic LPS delivery protein PorZ [Namhaeicola litoreus]|uniref:Two-component regulator propeller domain-containing protein n=1 Tax=Namhaeicola litoreus TaxID=1052145 RepID=A0ABW3Y088_9FLAO
MVHLRFFICLNTFLFSALVFSQEDFSNLWEDHYSYNNVKDLVIREDQIFAAADNAAFIYNEDSGSTKKFSSVFGLSGKTTTSIIFSEIADSFVLGYETGLIEIVDNNGNIRLANDIERLDISGQKQINHIAEFENLLYLSTPFGIVEYNMKNLRFGDTFYIGAGSVPVFVNETTVFNKTIFAATTDGIFSANVENPNLIDFNNWKQPTGELLGNFSSITVFNNRPFTAKGNILYEMLDNVLIPRQTFDENILALRASDQFLSVTLNNMAIVLSTNLQTIDRAGSSNDYRFSLNTSFTQKNEIYLGTKEFGILKKKFFSDVYEEIHPVGPTSNEVFSITAQNGDVWVVYGGYDAAFTPLNKRAGFSHYRESENSWFNQGFDPTFPALDLVNITLDPMIEGKAYLSSWNSGILVLENDEPVVLWNDTNSGLEDLYPPGNPNSSIRINGTAFDYSGNLWVANAWVPNRLKKLETNGNWKSVNLSSIITNEAFGLTELVVDRSNNIWIGSRRNGALVYRENGDLKKALITETSKGNLPDLNVISLAVDRNNRVWLGTRKGLVVFSNPSSLFSEDIYAAEPIIVEDDGIPKRLLGDQPINTIAIDGADNKWFGTDTGGVLCTNGSGQETLYSFNKDNSPLASNRILKISIDDSSGKVYIATDKGIVAFKNNVSPYGEALDEVYAYPNPAKSEHETITIDGRNGTHLPRGTNVKILDVAGRLVFETNVIESQSPNGGKVVWNKKNLAGRTVASGVYLVLLTLPDTSETSITKIAIIN